jgi:hypothetical protein
VNSAQRRLVGKCAVGVSLVVVVVVFEHWILENWSWLKWAALPIMVIVAAVEGRPEKPPNIERWASSHPLIKPWLFVCALVIASIAVATTQTSFRIADQWTLRAVVLVFLVMLGPFVIVGLRERYRELGRDNDAT